MKLALAALAPLLALAGLGGTPATAAPARAADDGAGAIVMTATTGPRLLVEPDRAGVNVLAADVTAAPGRTIEGLTVRATGGSTPDCGSIPARLAGAGKVHCELALPALSAGASHTYTFTAEGRVAGQAVSRTLTFEASASTVTLTLKVAGQVRRDSPIGAGSGLPQVAPASPVRGELQLRNDGTQAVTAAVPGWTCPSRSLAARATVTCTRTVTAPSTEGSEGSLDAAATLTDAQGRTGQFTRAGRFQTRGAKVTPALATTGASAGQGLALALGLIGAGLALRRASRIGVR